MAITGFAGFLAPLIEQVHADQIAVDNTKTLWECGVALGGIELCGSASAALYMDSSEQDPANDYYAVKLTVQDQNPSSDDFIGQIWVDLTFPPAAQESPSNHQPGPGCSLVSTSLTFTFYAISFPLAVPGTCTDYSTSTDGSGFHVHWHQCAWDGGCPANPVTNDYSEFGVGIVVPQGSTVPVSVHAGVTLTHHLGGGGAFTTSADAYGSLYACCHGTFATFGLVPSPNSLNIQAGKDGTSTITLTSFNGFSGTVTLTASVTPSTSPGVQVLFQGCCSSTTVSLSGGSVQVPISILTDYSTPQYTYHIQLNAGSGAIVHQDTIVVSVSSPPPAPTYVFPGVFNGVGSQITVCLYSSVSVRITLYATTSMRGSVSVDVRRDIVWYSDNTLTTLSKTVVVNAGNTAIDMGSFSASDLTGGDIGQTRQYYVKVYWAGQTIYDPTDPNNREWVQTTYCGCGCGGGGSIAFGTLVTMEDTTKLPVQNLKVGERMLGYDTVTGQFTVSLVEQITAVDTDNMIIIHTTAGTPFRVDANPHQTLWTKRADNSVLWLPVTELKPGDSLFTDNGWVNVTSIEFAQAGTHVMFDIVATQPYFAAGYLDPIYKV